MALREFKLPDPGEGLTEAELVTWHVKPGDTVKVNDIIVEIETAKSLVELPVPFAGTVASLDAAGTPIITIDDGLGGAPDAGTPAPAAVTGQGDAPAPTTAAASSADAPPEIAEGLIGGTTSTGRTAVLVGYGVKQTEAKRRPRAGARAVAGSTAAPSVRQPEIQHEPASPERASSWGRSVTSRPSRSGAAATIGPTFFHWVRCATSF